MNAGILMSLTFPQILHAPRSGEERYEIFRQALVEKTRRDQTNTIFSQQMTHIFL